MKYIATIIGALMFFTYAVNAESGKHSHSHGHKHKHKHSQVSVDHYKNIPTLKIHVYKDAKKGWNLQVITTNFKFTPENVNKNNIPGEGHAHLYINGVKTRLYSKWFYIRDLPLGKNEIKVTLNSNDHSDLTLNNKIIEATELMEIKRIDS